MGTDACCGKGEEEEGEGRKTKLKLEATPFEYLHIPPLLRENTNGVKGGKKERGGGEKKGARDRFTSTLSQSRIKSS